MKWDKSKLSYPYICSYYSKLTSLTNWLLFILSNNNYFEELKINHNKTKSNHVQQYILYIILAISKNIEEVVFNDYSSVNNAIISLS